MKDFYMEEEKYRRINGIKLKRLRKEKHMSQEKLAELTGLCRSQIQRIENGKVKDTRAVSAIMLAKVFDVSVEELYEEK